MKQTTDADDTPEVTRTDRFELDEASEAIVNQTDSGVIRTKAKVWAVLECDTDEFRDLLAAATNERNMIVHKADRNDGAVSVVLEKFADEV
jgi:hypothetical protein